ncbi:uncharacterized protein GJ701_003808 isoform 1-T1 [Geothlypis trichas]
MLEDKQRQELCPADVSALKSKERLNHNSPGGTEDGIALMLSTGPQHQVAIYHRSWQASLLHPAPASLKENKTSDTYSNNAVADQQSIYTMVFTGLNPPWTTETVTLLHNCLRLRMVQVAVPFV